MPFNQTKYYPHVFKKFWFMQPSSEYSTKFEWGQHMTVSNDIVLVLTSRQPGKSCIDNKY